jgi:hypothetical protein
MENQVHGLRHGMHGIGAILAHWAGCLGRFLFKVVANSTTTVDYKEAPAK